jgi:prevent-host-death family protein
MKLKEDVQPITYLKNKTAELVERISGHGRSVVITQNGKAKVVVMDVELYDRWREAMALLKILASSEAEVLAGRVLEPEEVWKAAEKMIAGAGEDA